MATKRKRRNEGDETEETANTEGTEEKHEKREKRERFSREMTCALTREEVEERAQHAATILERRDQKESDYKEQAKRWKNEIAQLDVEHRIISSEVRSKTTVRPVDCERIFDYEAGTVTEVRSDTGETINSRRMADSERQRDLDLDGEFDE